VHRGPLVFKFELVILTKYLLRVDWLSIVIIINLKRLTNTEFLLKAGVEHVNFRRLPLGNTLLDQDMVLELSFLNLLLNIVALYELEHHLEDLSIECNDL